MSLSQHVVPANTSPQQPTSATSKPQTTMDAMPGATQFHNANGTPQGAINAVTHAENAFAATAELARNPEDSASQLPTSAQEILKRVSASTNVNAESVEWAAAREQVLKSMASNNDRSLPFSRPRGRGRGRARGSTFQNGDRNAAGVAPAISTPDGAAVTPVRRGRGGRPRGSRSSRGRGRGGRRKRDEDTDGGPSDSDDDNSDDSNSLTTTPTVTKSGRNITKPSPFNPAPQQSPTSGTKRKRPYHRREVDQILCLRCSRGHSPPSNQIVLCDGCDSAYHQWCHDPMIDKEVAENIHSSWFCGNCQHAREVESLPLEQRVSGAHLSLEERDTYLSMLSSKTLVSLLMRATILHPELPLFAPDARSLINSKSKTASHKNSALSTPPAFQTAPYAAQSRSQLHANTNAKNHHHHPNSAPPPPRSGTSPSQTLHPTNGNPPHAPQEDPYPDYTNEDGDPPATYPRPGRGPIKLRPTTDSEDLPWMMEDNSDVFSHFVADANGTLVAQKNRTGPLRGGSAAPLPLAPRVPSADADLWRQRLQQLQQRHQNHASASQYGNAVAGQQQQLQQQQQQQQQQRGPTPAYGMRYNSSDVYGGMR